MKNIRHRLLRILRLFFLTFSGFLICCIVFAFTTGPYWIYHWLGTSVSDYKFKPSYIIIMGGAGYPSESALMRAWYAAKVYKENPGAKVIVTQPAAAGVQPESSDAFGIRTDLILRGVDSSKIILELEGKNTREEGMNVIKLAPEAPSQGCVIITGPEHMRRAVLTFKKLGFTKVGGIPTFNASGPVDLDYKDSKLGGRNVPLPEVGGSLQLRYQFWNHLKYQVICYRELFGLLWYKMRGWI